MAFNETEYDEIKRENTMEFIITPADIEEEEKRREKIAKKNTKKKKTT